MLPVSCPRSSLSPSPKDLTAYKELQQIFISSRNCSTCSRFQAVKGVDSRYWEEKEKIKQELEEMVLESRRIT